VELFSKFRTEKKKGIESPTVWAAAAAADATQGYENSPSTIPPKAEEETPKTKKLLVSHCESFSFRNYKKSY
jgi:hypothetical protein